MEEQIEQLYYIRSEMMRLINQLKLLTNYISDETNIANTQTLGHLSNNIANKVSKLNEQIGRIFKKQKAPKKGLFVFYSLNEEKTNFLLSGA